MFYKINRAARNLQDYAELEALEGELALPLISVTEPTENTAAGRMFRRQLAVFAAFQTEQQMQDVRDGQRKRVESGLFVGVAPYGYRNVRIQGRSLVETDPVQTARIKRIFDLYAHRHVTLDGVCEILHREAVPYSAAQPRWRRSMIYQVLTSRAYLGEVPYQGQWYPGVHEPLVSIDLFERVQTLLGGSSYKSHELAYAGELITCGHCGGVITGERIIKKISGREHIYYRCSRYNQKGHPRVRLTEAQLDCQVMDLFARLRQPEEVREWFAAQLRKLTRAEQEEDRAQEHRAAGSGGTGAVGD